jgi:hypothetical protein
MQFKLTALLDDQARKEMKETILSLAKGIARNEVETTIRDEVKRLAADLSRQIGDKNSWHLKGLVLEAVQRFFTDQWTPLSKDLQAMMAEAIRGSLQPLINELAKAACEYEIKKKMKDMTVWKAESQDEYVRKVVRSELRSILKP